MDTQTQFTREMIIIRTAWLRYAPYPAEPDEALRYGWIKQAQDGTYYIPSEDDEETGEPVAEGDEAWPISREAIRQVRIIADRVESDIRCPYNDIPMPWNKCKPIMGRPWGMGLPEVTEPIQKAINMLASTFFNHAGYYQSPQETISESMYNLLKDDELHEIGAFPGRRIRVPDALWMEMNGRVSAFDSPPPLPASLVSYFQMLLEIFDDLGSQGDVTRGNATPDATSGRAIEALQAAAKGLYGYLATNTTAMLQDIAKIMLYAMRDMMSEHQVMQRVDQYPIQVYRAIKQRSKNIEYDISVSVTSAAGNTKRMDKAEARDDFDNGRISHQTFLEKVETVNPEAELKRIAAETKQDVAPAAGGPSQGVEQMIAPTQ